MSETPKQDGPSTFTPIHPFQMEDPKSWASTIGMMHWDNDKVVFSKRSLLEFLRSVDVTVGTNFKEIQKLPKYATFGHFSQEATDAAVADLVDAEIADPTTDSKLPESHSTVPRSNAGAGRTTRKVVDPPGGKQSLKIYGEEYEEEDALSLAPPRNGGSGVDVEVERMERMRLHVEPEVDGGAKVEDIPAATKSGAAEGYRPTRKVREGPGGKSQMGSALFGGDDGEEEERSASSGNARRNQGNASKGFW